MENGELKNARAAPWAGAAGACCSSAGPLPLGAAAPDVGQAGGDWQDLVLLYTTDVKGKIDPCG